MCILNNELKRNTAQKEIVERIVFSACDHPTAEVVYQRARAELPNISLGTVYRILKNLAQDGKILEIPISNAPSVFDKTICLHAHLVCDKCGCVTDVFLDENKFADCVKDTSGCNINKAQILLHGVCAKCANDAE